MQARGWHWGAISAVAATCAVRSAGAVVSPEELAAYETRREQPVVQNLAQLAPDAVAPYEQAVAAMHAADLPTAEKLLETVHHDVPGFTAATRRLCLVKGGLKQRDAAIALCREAAGDGSARSLAALSFALTGFGDLGAKPTAPEVAEALELATRAVKRDADDVLAQRAMCFAARAAGEANQMRGCTKALERLDTMQSASAMWLERGRVIVAAAAQRSEPDPVRLDEGAYAAKRAAKIRDGWIEPTFVLAQIAIQRNDMEALAAALSELTTAAPNDVRTAHYDTIAALAAGDVARARTSLARAVELGLAAEQHTQLQQQIDAADPLSARWLPVLGGVIVFSLGAMAWYGRRRKSEVSP